MPVTLSPEIEQALHVGQRRIDEIGVVVVHAGAEDRRDPCRRRARHDAERRGDRHRRDELQAVAHLQPHQVGQPACRPRRRNRRRSPSACPSRSACRPRRGTGRDSGRAARPAPRSRRQAACAPGNPPGCMPRNTTPRTLSPATAMTWPSAVGVAVSTPGTAAQARQQVGRGDEPVAAALDAELAADARHLAQHLDAEAVHHRHHDDQRADARARCRPARSRRSPR